MILNPMQRLERAAVTLMRDKEFMFLSGVIVYGDTKVVDNPKITARTDGVNVEYGKDFVVKLNDAELMGLVLHEKLHCAFRHLTTWLHLYEENPKLANMACDFVINLIIYDRYVKDGFVKLPPGGCLDEQYRGMDAGGVYRALKQKHGDDSGVGNGQQGFDEHDWEANAGLSDKEIEQLSHEIDQALRQGGILASKAGANVDRAIADMLQPKVDWRKALRDFISSSKPGDDYSTYRRLDRRYMSQGLTMPTMYSDHVHRVFLGTDTSGSIDNRVLAEFLAEVHGICESIKPGLVDLVYWGTHVVAHEVYEGPAIDSLRQSTKPRGGGGTAPSCVSQYLRQHNIKPDCIIMLSDGYVDGDWGDGWPAPVLWCLNNNHHTAPTGVTVYM